MPTRTRCPLCSGSGAYSLGPRVQLRERLLERHGLAPRKVSSPTAGFLSSFLRLPAVLRAAPASDFAPAAAAANAVSEISAAPAAPDAAAAALPSRRDVVFRKSPRASDAALIVSKLQRAEAAPFQPEISPGGTLSFSGRSPLTQPPFLDAASGERRHIDWAASRDCARDWPRRLNSDAPGQYQQRRQRPTFFPCPIDSPPPSSSRGCKASTVAFVLPAAAPKTTFKSSRASSKSQESLKSAAAIAERFAGDSRGQSQRRKKLPQQQQELQQKPQHEIENGEALREEWLRQHLLCGLKEQERRVRRCPFCAVAALQSAATAANETSIAAQESPASAEGGKLDAEDDASQQVGLPPFSPPSAERKGMRFNSYSRAAGVRNVEARTALVSASGSTFATSTCATAAVAAAISAADAVAAAPAALASGGGGSDAVGDTAPACISSSWGDGVCFRPADSARAAHVQRLLQQRLLKEGCLVVENLTTEETRPQFVKVEYPAATNACASSSSPAFSAQTTAAAATSCRGAAAAVGGTAVTEDGVLLQQHHAVLSRLSAANKHVIAQLVKQGYPVERALAAVQLANYSPVLQTCQAQAEELEAAEVSKLLMDLGAVQAREHLDAAKEAQQQQAVAAVLQEDGCAALCSLFPAVMERFFFVYPLLSAWLNAPSCVEFPFELQAQGRGEGIAAAAAVEAAGETAAALRDAAIAPSCTAKTAGEAAGAARADTASAEIGRTARATAVDGEAGTAKRGATAEIRSRLHATEKNLFRGGSTEDAGSHWSEKESRKAAAAENRQLLHAVLRLRESASRAYPVAAPAFLRAAIQSLQLLLALGNWEHFPSLNTFFTHALLPCFFKLQGLRVNGDIRHVSSAGGNAGVEKTVAEPTKAAASAPAAAPNLHARKGRLERADVAAARAAGQGASQAGRQQHLQTAPSQQQHERQQQQQERLQHQKQESQQRQRDRQDRLQCADRLAETHRGLYSPPLAGEARGGRAVDGPGAAAGVLQQPPLKVELRAEVLAERSACALLTLQLQQQWESANSVVRKGVREGLLQALLRQQMEELQQILFFSNLGSLAAPPAFLHSRRADSCRLLLWRCLRQVLRAPCHQLQQQQQHVHAPTPPPPPQQQQEKAEIQEQEAKPRAPSQQRPQHGKLEKQQQQQHSQQHQQQQHSQQHQQHAQQQQHQAGERLHSHQAPHTLQQRQGQRQEQHQQDRESGFALEYCGGWGCEERQEREEMLLLRNVYVQLHPSLWPPTLVFRAAATDRHLSLFVQRLCMLFEGVMEYALPLSCQQGGSAVGVCVSRAAGAAVGDVLCLPEIPPRMLTAAAHPSAASTAASFPQQQQHECIADDVVYAAAAAAAPTQVCTPTSSSQHAHAATSASAAAAPKGEGKGRAIAGRPSAYVAMGPADKGARFGQAVLLQQGQCQTSTLHSKVQQPQQSAPNEQQRQHLQVRERYRMQGEQQQQYRQPQQQRIPGPQQQQCRVQQHEQQARVASLSNGESQPRKRELQQVQRKQQQPLQLQRQRSSPKGEDGQGLQRCTAGKQETRETAVTDSVFSSKTEVAESILMIDASKRAGIAGDSNTKSSSPARSRIILRAHQRKTTPASHIDAAAAAVEAASSAEDAAAADTVPAASPAAHRAAGAIVALDRGILQSSIGAGAAAAQEAVVSPPFMAASCNAIAAETAGTAAADAAAAVAANVTAADAGAAGSQASPQKEEEENKETTTEVDDDCVIIEEKSSSSLFQGSTCARKDGDRKTRAAWVFTANAPEGRAAAIRTTDLRGAAAIGAIVPLQAKKEEGGVLPETSASAMRNTGVSLDEELQRAIEASLRTYSREQTAKRRREALPACGSSSAKETPQLTQQVAATAAASRVVRHQLGETSAALVKKKRQQHQCSCPAAVAGKQMKRLRCAPPTAAAAGAGERATAVKIGPQLSAAATAEAGEGRLDMQHQAAHQQNAAAADASSRKQEQGAVPPPAATPPAATPPAATLAAATLTNTKEEQQAAQANILLGHWTSQEGNKKQQQRTLACPSAAKRGSTLGAGQHLDGRKRAIWGAPAAGQTQEQQPPREKVDEDAAGQGEKQEEGLDCQERNICGHKKAFLGISGYSTGFCEASGSSSKPASSSHCLHISCRPDGSSSSDHSMMRLGANSVGSREAGTLCDSSGNGTDLSSERRQAESSCCCDPSPVGAEALQETPANCRSLGLFRAAATPECQEAQLAVNVSFCAESAASFSLHAETLAAAFPCEPSETAAPAYGAARRARESSKGAAAAAAPSPWHLAGALPIASQAAEDRQQQERHGDKGRQQERHQQERQREKQHHVADAAGAEAGFTSKAKQRQEDGTEWTSSFDVGAASSTEGRPLCCMRRQQQLREEEAEEILLQLLLTNVKTTHASQLTDASSKGAVSASAAGNFPPASGGRLIGPRNDVAPSPSAPISSHACTQVALDSQTSHPPLAYFPAPLATAAAAALARPAAVAVCPAGDCYRFVPAAEVFEPAAASDSSAEHSNGDAWQRTATTSASRRAAADGAEAKPDCQFACRTCGRQPLEPWLLLLQQRLSRKWRFFMAPLVRRRLPFTAAAIQAPNKHLGNATVGGGSCGQSSLGEILSTAACLPVDSRYAYTKASAYILCRTAAAAASSPACRPAASLVPPRPTLSCRGVIGSACAKRKTCEAAFSEKKEIEMPHYLCSSGVGTGIQKSTSLRGNSDAVNSSSSRWRWKEHSNRKEGWTGAGYCCNSTASTSALSRGSSSVSSKDSAFDSTTTSSNCSSSSSSRRGSQLEKFFTVHLQELEDFDGGMRQKFLQETRKDFWLLACCSFAFEEEENAETSKGSSACGEKPCDIRPWMNTNHVSGAQIEERYQERKQQEQQQQEAQLGEAAKLDETCSTCLAQQGDFTSLKKRNFDCVTAAAAVRRKAYVSAAKHCQGEAAAAVAAAGNEKKDGQECANGGFWNTSAVEQSSSTAAGYSSERSTTSSDSATFIPHLRSNLHHFADSADYVVCPCCKQLGDKPPLLLRTGHWLPTAAFCSRQMLFLAHARWGSSSKGKNVSSKAAAAAAGDRDGAPADKPADDSLRCADLEQGFREGISPYSKVLRDVESDDVVLLRAVSPA